MKAEDIDGFDELLEEAEANVDLARDWDCSFVSDMRDRYDRWGAGTFVSDAQLEQLERIAASR
jgi:hypothetical protein